MEELTENTIMALDNTKRGCLVECKRKFYYQYILNLKTYYGSCALRYGLVWHAGMENYYSHIAENGWTKDGGAIQAAFEAMQTEWEQANEKETYYNDYRTLENCCKSFLEYIQHFAQDELMLTVVKTEEPFKVFMEVENEEEDKYFKGLTPFHFTGKIDAEIELNGQRWLNEHKTTGQPLSMQVNRLHRSAQVMGYFYAKQRINRSIEEETGSCADIMGVLMTMHHLSARKSTAKGREGEYGTPKIDFIRSPQVFADNDIRQWRLAFLSTALDLQQELERNLWPMNLGSCFNFGSCPFLELCEQAHCVERLEIDETRFYVAEPWQVAKSVTAAGVIY